MKRREVLRNIGLSAGAITMAGSLVTLLNSCEKQLRNDWTPLLLEKEEALFLSSFVDTLLPKTETPGGLDVNVDVFMDAAFYHLNDAKGREDIKNNIADFNAWCIKNHGKSFHKLSEELKIRVILEEEKKAPTYNQSVWGTAVGNQKPVGFYRSMKSMALWGYFTSETIGKEYLNYDPIPQVYNGCIPLDEVGNSWSL